MGEGELRGALGRAVGDPGGRPDLGDLWSAGRGRRRRHRVLGSAAAVLAAGAVVVGAVALVSADGDEGVVAGPGGDAVAAPPAEPADGLVTLDVVAGPAVDGLPTAEPGGSLRVTYRGFAETFERGRLATWERWDGDGWVEEVGLIAGDAEPGGFRGGAVAPLDPPPTVPSDTRTGPGPDTFPVPTEVAPGWYRVCVPLTSPTETVIAGTIPAGAGPEATSPPETHVAAGQAVEPCAQLRVPEPGVPAGAPVAGPPPLEPADRSMVTAARELPVRPGEEVALAVDTAGGTTLGADTTWEQWDGFRWVPTHLVEGFLGDGPGPTLASLLGAEQVPIPDVAHVATEAVTPIHVLAPPVDELLSPWHRVCVDTAVAAELRPCVQIFVLLAPATVDPALLGES